MKSLNVFVIGAGAMGNGIAQICAQWEHRVKITDAYADALAKALENIKWSLAKMEEKGTLKESSASIFSRIRACSDVTDAKDSDIVVEAAYENLEVKRDIFKRLEEVCPEKTIFGTNTSSIPITEIATGLKHPERVVGIHFFNPVHKMRLVEIIMGLLTGEETVSVAKEFVISIHKEPVIVKRDTAGFIVNRINGMAFLEALRLYEGGVASVKDIDKAMKLALGHPMGPFELMDLVGLDVVLNARMAIYNETRSPAHYPPAVLKKMVESGFLGRKTKKGFYNY